MLFAAEVVQVESDKDRPEDVVTARVLVALNPSQEAMRVPLAAGFAEQLRALRVKPPRP
jgi:hypothetical protein